MPTPQKFHLSLSILLTTIFSFFLIQSFNSKTNYVAILLNNSKYYYNYRMVSNTLAIYNNLKAIGYTDEEIQVQNNQCTYNLPANIPPGYQRIDDDNISKNLVNQNMQLDLNLEDVSLKRHIMSIANRYEQYDSLNKR